jgi:hypothetical protein
MADEQTQAPEEEITDQEEYQDPGSPVTRAPVPPETFGQTLEGPSAQEDSSAAYREAIREGKSEDEALEISQKRAEENREAMREQQEEQAEAASDDGEEDSPSVAERAKDAVTPEEGDKPGQRRSRRG